MPTQRLRVKGMTCAACVRRVEKVLTRAPEVQSATVNLATETAEVETAQPVDITALIEAIRAAGYDAEPIEPAAPTAEDDPARPLQRRLWVSLALTAPIVALSMFLPHPLPAQGWILLALTLPVQFGVALPLYRAAWGALRHGTANMEVLVLLGTLAAFFYSFALTLQGQAHHLYYETSAVIITLVLLGRTLEARARGQAKRALESLWNLLPREVLRWDGAAYRAVPLSQVQVGDRLLVRTGDRVPVDGVVLEGRGWVDESAITGESLPQERAAGDRVLGGALVVDGVLHLEAQAVGEQTLLAQVAQAVAQAQARKASIQRVADQIAAVFVPIVVAIALLTLLGWWLATRSLADALVPAVSVLVIACPCAVGLAVPIAMLTGATRAARAGVLIRGFEALERVRRIDTLVLDKTGTLTLGTPRLVAINTDGISETDALSLAAGLEQSVRHPLAEAILQAAQERGITPASVEQVQVVAGGGVRAMCTGEPQGAPPRAPTPLSHRVGEGLGVRAHTILLGSPRFLQEHGVALDGFCEPPPAGSPCEQGEPIRLGSPRDAGGTLRRGADTFPVLLAVDNRIVAGFEFADEPLPEVAETLRALRQAGLRLVLCSGDRAEAVAAFAERVGIDEWHAAQLPHQKAEVVRRLQAEGRRVAFVGDGINDAPALAEADLGVVVATGTQLAAENADLILLNRDLRTVLTALRLSQAIYRVIRQNLFLAFVYNTLGIPLAAMGYLNPMVAALAMSLSSVSVVGNALRLLRWV
ncbi:MAG: cation-translocating P-type ATPase [Armatimonadota bacterium]|nr:cation-translocating P-type ATPase [Armatimonadota bacterium]